MRLLLADMAPFRLYQRPLLFVRSFAAEQKQSPSTRIRPQLNLRSYLQLPIQLVASKEGRGGERFTGFEHPASSEKRKRTRYPIYIAVGLYLTLSLFWLFSWDQVPITGRWRLQYSPTPNPKLLADDDPTNVFLGSGRPPSSEDNLPVLRLRQTRSVLDRLLSASGLSHQEWNLLIIDITPG